MVLETFSPPSSKNFIINSKKWCLSVSSLIPRNGVCLFTFLGMMCALSES